MTSHFLSADRLSIAVPEAFVTVIASVADLAVVTDREGRIKDVILNIDEAARFDRTRWIGVPVEDTVTEESRPKLRQMLEAALAGQDDQRWREINHLVEGVGEIPVRYKAVAADDLVMFLGREMGSVAALQAQLVEAQRALDQDYGRLRQLETRYRVLFQTSSEPLLVLAPQDRRIREANAAAGQMFGREPQDLAGTVFESLFAEDEGPAVVRAMEAVAATGQGGTGRWRLHDRPAAVEVRTNVFRAADSVNILCRLEAAEARTAASPDIEQMLVDIVDRIPDAVVLTDVEARILWCNEAFLSLAEVVMAAHLRGEPLARFLGRPGVDLDLIVANACEHGRLHAFSAQLRGAFGSTTRVEVSATAVAEADPPVIGFVMRDLSRHEQLPRRHMPAAGSPGGATEELMQLVGSVPLKELVRASTEEIEKMCIEAALQMTGNNRASAAEVLGLSRQSLYVKLRRFGLMDPSDRE